MSIKSLLANPSIDSKELAYVLFPTNIHPKKALSRVANGNKTLDKDQLHRLAIYLGVPISDLFSSDEWAGFVRINSISFYFKNKLVLMHLKDAKGYLFNDRSEPKFFEYDQSSSFTEILNRIEN